MVAGATGAVGKEIVGVLEKRGAALHAPCLLYVRV
jgi:aspartate-semialdehyde dehydrogenase